MRTYSAGYERFETARKQLPNPTNHRQLRSRDDLRIGQDVALLQPPVGARTPWWGRAAFVGLEYLAGLATQQRAKAVIAAMRRSLQETRAVQGLVPQWRGTVQSIGPDGVTVRPTHEQVGHDYAWDAYLNAPERVPVLDDPSQVDPRRGDFHELGLAPIPQGQSCAGRWVLATLVEITPQPVPQPA